MQYTEIDYKLITLWHTVNNGLGPVGKNKDAQSADKVNLYCTTIWSTFLRLLHIFKCTMEAREQFYLGQYCLQYRLPNSICILSHELIVVGVAV